MQVEVTVLGATGYGGGELLRLLCHHPAVGVIHAISRSQAGQPLTEVHPHLHPLTGQCFESWPCWKNYEDSDQPLVVFSALPHRALAARFAELHPALCRLSGRRLVFIDLSGDFRMDSAGRYFQHNGMEHPCPQYLDEFVYGLPELNREALRAARWIANPGCFATALCLSLLPIRAWHGMGLIAISGATGSSGSGSQPSLATHHPVRAQDYRAYALLRHRHLGEAELMLDLGGARDYSLAFTAHSTPLVRGIYTTLHCLIPNDHTPAEVQERFAQQYVAEPFVRLVKRPPRVAAVVGSNYAELGLALAGRQLVVCSAVDNLGKGMAGQAVQNMNLALGLDERSGLGQCAVYP